MKGFMKGMLLGAAAGAAADLALHTSMVKKTPAGKAMQTRMVSGVLRDLEKRRHHLREQVRGDVCVPGGRPEHGGRFHCGVQHVR